MSVFQIHISIGAAIPEDFAGENQAPESEAPDGRIFVTDEAGECVARVALWWTDTPGEKLGTIGGFFALTPEAAERVLEEAAGLLAKQGADTAVGPMNGNTWRSYRFVEETDGTPPFLLEPRNPEAYPAWWRAAGFEELSHYTSSRMVLDGAEAVSPALKARLMRSGLSIRRMEVERYDDELRLIHSLSLKSFAGNFLYTPLGEEAFLGAYRKVRDYVDPDLVRIAERDGTACGFVFGIPDLEAAARGGQPALIVKTLAVDPGARSAGLGSLLVDDLHRMGREKGYLEAIHALQHENNTSLKITGRHEGRVFRRYVLFSRSL